MNLKISFSWVGIVIFVLPMIINIFYAVFPPAEGGAKTGTESNIKTSASNLKWLEIVENVSRIVYLIVLTFLVSKKPLDLKSVWLYGSAAFLVLYYATWIRYFTGGRKISLLNKPFLFVPIPLAVFPVLYFLCAAIWMNNIPAAIIMLIFGAAHITVSIKSFDKDKK